MSISGDGGKGIKGNLAVIMVRGFCMVVVDVEGDSLGSDENSSECGV